MKRQFTSIILFFVPFLIHAQNLTISTTGQTGTSGTNWSISGSNPVIITATGTASVNTSVIMGYLNTGTSVIVESLTSNGSVYLASSSAIVKNAGGDATLTFKAAHQVIVSSSITSSSSKLNVVLWSDFNNNNIAGVGIASTINTNGGHLWAGGSSSAAGTYTWNGLTVGNGPSVGSSSSNHYGMDFFSSSIATGGGDILLWAGAGSISAYDGIGLQNNPHLNAGSGNVTLITRQIFNVGNTLSITSTGKLTLTTDSNNPWTSAFNWSTTTAGSNVTLTSALGQPLQINNFSTLGGLSIGVYDGFGSSFSFTNNQNINLNSSINIPGPINVYGGAISLGVGVEVIASTANGSMNFQGKNGFSTVANSGSTRGKLMTTGGGNITISADSDNNNSGTLDIDWLTIDGNTGNVLLECAAFVWNTASQVSLPEFYSSGGALTIRNTTSSNYDISTNWFAMFGTFGGVTLGREGGTGAIALVSCTSCHSSALNFGTTAFQIAGPITALGAIINANINLHSTNSGSDILLKATKYVIVGENVSIRSNNGDITFWSNSDGIDNATDGDFIGIYSGVSINSANGLTNQTAGGGTITMAGGTTSQTLASGTVVPTDYALSTRTTNWVDVLPPGGVNLGEKRSAVGGLNTVNIYSGGGDIVIKGKSNSSSAGVQWFSGPTGASQILNSGNGTVTVDGLSTSSTAHGIEFMSYASVVSPTIISSNTSSTAIRIKGETSSTNNRAGYQGTIKLEANGIGGGIEVNGKVASSSNYAAIEAGTLNAYALSGPITFISEGGLGLKAGGVWGKGTLASSSSNITLKSDNVSVYTATIETTGTLTVEPLGTSFASALTFPITNLTVGNTVSGLTLGKSTNTANITFANATSIAGPITVFGGVVSANANITTSNATSISLLAKSGLRFSASGITLQTGGGAVVLSGDHDANSSGNIIAEGALTITTNGGAISMGGGATGSDFAYGIGTSSTIANDQTAGIWVRGAVNFNSGNGNISIRGYAANASPTVQHVPSWGIGLGLGAALNTNPASVTINSGTGTLLIEGYARNPSGLNTNSYGVVFNNWETTTTESLTITSANTTANAIRLMGNTENTQQGQRTKNSLRFWSVNNNIRATGTGGGITLSGKTFDGNDHPQICWSGGNILATSGPIVINTENEALEIGNDMYVGSRSGIAGNTTSSANIRFSIDDFTAASGIVRIASTGSLTIEPFGSSFTDYTPITNTIQGFTTASRWSLNENAQTLTGLTIGKPLNVSNITIGSTTTIAGPVTVYGGNININENINTTSGGTSGDILLKATSDITFAKAKTISSTGGDMIFWSDADGNGAGDIFFEADQNTSYTNPVTLSTGGGHLWLGGGSVSTTWNGLTVGDGYAVGNTARSVGGSFTHYNGIMIQATSINTLGGQIKMRGMGKAGTYSHPSYSGGMYLVGSGTMNSGGGNIDIEAIAQSGNDGNYGLYNLGAYAFAPGAGDLTIFGDASASSASFGSNAVGNGVLLWSGAISSTGNINLSGKKSSGTGTFGVYINVNIATTGSNKNITFEADHLNINGSSPRISSSGQLILKPFNSSTSIGLAGASGTLAIPSSYFSTNFVDGFSNIQIGSNSQTGAISSNAFTLRDNLTLLTSGSLTLGGKPILGSNNVTLGSDITTINVGSPANYFQTNGSGTVIRSIANNTNLLFPIGNAAYNPLSLHNKTGSSDLFGARVFDSVSLNGVSGTLITTPHVKATWDISKTNANTGSGIDMTFSWAQSQEVGSISNFTLNHHNGGNWEIAAGATGAASGTSTKTITHSGYTGTFSPFAFGQGIYALPVELSKFTATCQSEYIQIDWTTASEIRNKAFELFKSDDAQDWKLIYTTDGQGDKATETHYAFNDLDKKTGYYRLKDIDEDGIENWSQIIFSDCKNEISGIQIYPNPATDYIKVITPISEHTTLNIISLEGKVLKTIPLISKQTLVSVKDLAKGIYIVEIKGNHNNFLLKFTKN